MKDSEAIAKIEAVLDGADQEQYHRLLAWMRARCGGVTVSLEPAHKPLPNFLPPPGVILTPSRPDPVSEFLQPRTICKSYGLDTTPKGPFLDGTGGTYTSRAEVYPKGPFE